MNPSIAPIGPVSIEKQHKQLKIPTTNETTASVLLCPAAAAGGEACPPGGGCQLCSVISGRVHSAAAICWSAGAVPAIGEETAGSSKTGLAGGSLNGLAGDVGENGLGGSGFASVILGGTSIFVSARNCGIIGDTSAALDLGGGLNGDGIGGVVAPATGCEGSGLGSGGV